MRSLIENTFRRQLKRLSQKCGCEPRVSISFVYTDEDFNYLVSISTGNDYAEQSMDTITEENIKRIVSGLIHRFEERGNTIRMSDYGPRVYNIHNAECTPYTREWDEVVPVVTHWDGEVRCDGPTLQEVCNG